MKAFSSSSQVWLSSDSMRPRSFQRWRPRRKAPVRQARERSGQPRPLATPWGPPCQLGGGGTGTQRRPWFPEIPLPKAWQGSPEDGSQRAGVPGAWSPGQKDVRSPPSLEHRNRLISQLSLSLPRGSQALKQEAPTTLGGHQLWGRAGSELSHHDDKGQTWALTFNSENRRDLPEVTSHRSGNPG